MTLGNFRKLFGFGQFLLSSSYASCKFNSTKPSLNLNPMFQTLYVIVVYGLILWNENFSLMVPYCSLGNKYTAKQTLMFLIFSPIVDIISLLILLFLTLKRKRVNMK